MYLEFHYNQFYYMLGTICSFFQRPTVDGDRKRKQTVGGQFKVESMILIKDFFACVCWIDLKHGLKYFKYDLYSVSPFQVLQMSTSCLLGWGFQLSHRHNCSVFYCPLMF